jgi:hypothetical protein
VCRDLGDRLTLTAQIQAYQGLMDGLLVHFDKVRAERAMYVIIRLTMLNITGFH